ncbi:unnamed protein product [Dovyalis caffra]|uniref:SET domain-containing protein n=1 Tax=Dovyalis caffra TaxID=77055 RepID=A0AAV1RIE3_9ROSI|nr:unnamed protein product [Dovyalis caffra]
MSVGVNTETLVRIEEIQGRGRGLVCTQPLRGGQVVLIDSPILLYSALPLTKQQDSTFLYCDKCFKTIQSASVSCPTCSHHQFCSPSCLSAALSSSHTPWVCQSLTRLRQNLDFLQHHCVERQIQARFLIAACNLAFVSPSDFQFLLSLQGRAEDEDPGTVQFLRSVISSLCPPPPIEGFSFSLELIAALVAKDKFNAFGLMEPLNLNEENGGQRSVRAYGIYPKAALFNHDCLPNACRFDYVDTANNGNTDIIVRMIHDVPQGREICLSYFPVNNNYSTRQKRLLEDYGFTCDCDRCKVEATWSDEEGDSDNGDDNEAMEEDVDEPMEVPSNGEDIDNDNGTDFPHAYFFLKYMCTRNNCWGTLAPLPSSDAKPSNLLECNACGNVKNDEVC